MTRQCRVAELFVHPIKGCRPQSVPAVEINRFGIFGDRELMVIKDPLNMLSQYRRISDGYDSGIVFGNYFNTLGEGTLRVGDVLHFDFREIK